MINFAKKLPAWADFRGICHRGKYITYIVSEMVEEYQLRLAPAQAADIEQVKRCVAKERGMDVRTINALRILRRSIDARGRRVVVNLKVRAYINEPAPELAYQPVNYPDVSDARNVIVVGEGPAGLFAALRLIELGVRPIVLERGKDVRERKKDLALVAKEQRVNPESNYCFGEGGAGAYSDGKLYTRSKKRGNVEKILNVFCQHGASTDILVDAHPHIGTDKLPRVIEAMRHTILKCGGEVRHQTLMTSLLIEKDSVVGVEASCPSTGEQRVYKGPVVLATGHSARDVYRYLLGAGVALEAKGIAVGVRLEHPSKLIDQIQYHNKEGRGKYLPAAEYSFVTQVEGRGVYSFCMCPGGFVIPSATGSRQVVVNGMSPSNRGTAWSNSGMVVQVEPDDVAAMGVVECATDDPLRVMKLQEALEHDCWMQAGMRQAAPAQRMGDFVDGKLSYDLPQSSYAPGLVSSPLHFWMPGFIASRLREAFRVFGHDARGFLTNEATLIAIETRTSSPVRLPRDPSTLSHVAFQGLFPCGEGAGYAGGIVSAAIDGERCAEMAALYLASLPR